MTNIHTSNSKFGNSANHWMTYIPHKSKQTKDFVKKKSGFLISELFTWTRYKRYHKRLIEFSFSYFRQYFICGGSDGPNGKNLALLMQAYVQRSDLNLAREIAPNGKELLG
jgi:hypothetical protein